MKHFSPDIFIFIFLSIFFSCVSLCSCRSTLRHAACERSLSHRRRDGSSGPRRPIVSSAASLSANSVATGPPGGGGKEGGEGVSLARFQDLALAHWTHSARKDRVQRGIHHLQHWLIPAPPPPHFLLNSGSEMTGKDMM